MIEWGIGRVSEKVIDKINIKNAAEMAMEKAVKKLQIANCKFKIDSAFLIIDGNALKNPELKKFNHKLIVKADEKVFSCSAASILAKVTRDRIMMRYHKKYPQYGFAQHKGYPTRYHIVKLKKYGPCRIHRRSFEPVFRILKTKNIQQNWRFLRQRRTNKKRTSRFTPCNCFTINKNKYLKT